MSSNYYYNGVDIYNLLNSTGISGSAPYIGFPVAPTSLYTSGIDRPQLLNYQVGGVDLSNSYEAVTTFGYIVPGEITLNTPLYINGNTGPSFKHVSGYCIGGSGGGGGGGGAKTASPKHSGGDGAPGSPGGYAAIVQYPITNGSSIVIDVGSGGIGGPNGKGDSNQGSDPPDGTPGNISSLTVGGTLVLQAYGGASGNSGNGGNSGSDGTDGFTNTPTTISIANGGNLNTISYSSDWPPDTAVGGTGGIGQAGDGTPNAQPGGTGSNGYVQLWFSYVA